VWREGRCEIRGEKIGGVMEVIGAAGDRRAEGAGWEIPVGDAVVEFQ
jgi:hypothetical protein